MCTVHIVHDERCAGYAAASHPEKPVRVTGCLDRLRQNIPFKVEYETSGIATDEQLLLAHSQDLLTNLAQSNSTFFESDTPCLSGIDTHARRSAAAAIRAMELCLEGKTAFSLMRPPGHHATRDRMMGFCYLNNMAVAVMNVLKKKEMRIAVFDFDVHYGNGTEWILAEKPETAFYSVHECPGYPAGGNKNNTPNGHNYPMFPRSGREKYRNAWKRALEDMMKFEPAMIGVSAGFDAYARDPVGHEDMLAEDYYWLGKELRNTGIPFFSVLEGGYSPDLPELVYSYLAGITGT